jgi:hypothetical protein
MRSKPWGELLLGVLVHCGISGCGVTAEKQAEPVNQAAAVKKPIREVIPAVQEGMPATDEMAGHELTKSAVQPAAAEVIEPLDQEIRSGATGLARA